LRHPIKVVSPVIFSRELAVRSCTYPIVRAKGSAANDGIAERWMVRMCQCYRPLSIPQNFCQFMILMDKQLTWNMNLEV